MQAYAEPRSTLSYTMRKRLDSAYYRPRTKEVDKDAISSIVPVPALAIKPLDEWDMEGRTIWSLNGRPDQRQACEIDENMRDSGRGKRIPGYG